MNEYLAAILLGFVEGLTEFLPVSSTAHIRIVQSLIGQDPEDPYWKMFAVVIQLGAIMAVVLYFWNRLWGYVKDFMGGSKATKVDGPNPDSAKLSSRTWWKHPLSLVLISFVVTAIPCFVIDKVIDDYLENFRVMGWALLIGGVAMWVVDTVFSKRASVTQLEDMSLKQAIVIGLFQILAAAFPGTSRSMSTIAGGQIMGLNRTTALEFSFLLSIPIMFAASGFKLLQYVLKAQNQMDGHQISVLGLGFFVSFLVALVVVAGLMKWVRKHGFIPFSIYRFAAGAWVLYAFASS